MTRHPTAESLSHCKTLSKEFSKIHPPSVVAGKMNSKGIIQRNSFQSIGAKTDICQNCWFRAHYIKQQAIFFWISIPVWGLKARREYLHVLVYIWVTLNVLCRVAMEGYLTTNRWGWLLYGCVCVCLFFWSHDTKLFGFHSSQTRGRQQRHNVHLGRWQEGGVSGVQSGRFPNLQRRCIPRKWHMGDMKDHSISPRSTEEEFDLSPPLAVAATNSAECLCMCTW